LMAAAGGWKRRRVDWCASLGVVHRRVRWCLGSLCGGGCMRLWCQ